MALITTEKNSSIQDEIKKRDVSISRVSSVSVPGEFFVYFFWLDAWFFYNTNEISKLFRWFFFCKILDLWSPIWINWRTREIFSSICLRLYSMGDFTRDSRTGDNFKHFRIFKFLWRKSWNSGIGQNSIFPPCSFPALVKMFRFSTFLSHWPILNIKPVPVFPDSFRVHKNFCFLCCFEAYYEKISSNFTLEKVEMFSFPRSVHIHALKLCRHWRTL